MDTDPALRNERAAMKTAVILFMAMVLAGSASLFAQKSYSVSKSLPTHGSLSMEVNVGEVRIERSDETRTIRLSIDPRGGNYDEAAMQSWIRRFDVAGDHAAIVLYLPNLHRDSGSSPCMTISLPTYTDLKFEMGAGQLTVKGIEGNKDLHVDVGQLTVGVEDRAEYHEIHTSSKLGQAEDEVWQQRAGGFFPSTNRTSSSGPYTLNATVDIGQVNVVKE
jgi:hypothetical protein